MRYLNGRVTHIFTNKIPPHNTIAYNKKLSKTFTQHTLLNNSERSVKSTDRSGYWVPRHTSLCSALYPTAESRQAGSCGFKNRNIYSIFFLLGYQYLCTCALKISDCLYKSMSTKVAHM